MTYKIEVTADSIGELAGRLISLGTAMSADPVMPEIRAQAETSAAPKRSRKKADEAPAADTPATEAPADAEPEAQAEAPAAEPEAAKIDVVADIQPLVLKLNAAQGREAVVAVLDQFGVERVTQLDEARLPELKTALEEALK